MAVEHDIVISAQVMIEFCAALTRKLKPNFSLGDTRIALSALAAFEGIDAHADMVLDAYELAVAEQLSWFDALIAEAALRSRCGILYSEDFSHDRVIGGSLLVRNPFLDA